MNSENRDIFLTGDFNYDTFKTSIYQANNVDSENFTNILSGFNLYKLIHKPTRIRPPSATLLDNIYINTPITMDTCSSGIITSNISDHFFVFGIFYDLKINNFQNSIRKRNFTEKNISIFSKILKNKTWDALKLCTDAESAFTMFYNFFHTNFENIFPEKLIQINYKNRHSWMPNSLLKSIKKNHILYKLSLTNPSEINKINYKTYNNKLNSIKRKAEREYYSNQLEINKSDMKKSWNIMKSVIGNKRKSPKKVSTFIINGKKITDEIRIANEFNNYFVSVGHTLASKLAHTNINPLDFVENNINSMVMPLIEEIEIVTIINSLKNSSPGWDGIPATLTKRLLNLYIKPLTFLINKSFSDGIFPDELKIAKVIPVYKSGLTMELNNYRPISVLNVFSKIYERIMYNKLIDFLDKYNILYRNQFGFRQGHSTHHALITLVDKITKSLDDGDIVIGVFLDLKKAFDTVNHKILLKKLYQYGIRGKLNEWFNNYLTNRSQYVLFNGQKSDIRDVTCGVPQGSILGPLLFILYINDLAGVSEKLFCVLFADDTNVFLNDKDINKLFQNIEFELSKLYNWLLVNKLTLNLAKTHFMVFHKSKHKWYNIDIKINNVRIEQVKHTKFLGVIFDDRLDWSNHISYINTKIAKGIGIICRAKKYFSRSALINLYNAFIFPYLIYCVEVWGNALSTHTQPLIKLQNKIVKIISYPNHPSDKNTLCTHTGVLPFNILVKYRIGLFMYKLFNDDVPLPLRQLYQSNKDIHSHFTRQSHHFHSMKGNSEFIYRTFVFQSVFIWNKIIQNLNINISFCRFKQSLKVFLLSKDISFRYDK